MQPFNIFEAGGREKFLKKKKDKKVKVETQSKQQSQISMIQNNIRRFLQLRRFYDSINSKFQLENQPKSQTIQSQLFFYWLLTPYRIRACQLHCKIIQFWHNSIVFDQNQLYQIQHKSLVERMIKLTVQFLQDIFLMDLNEGVRISKMMIRMYRNGQMQIDQKQARLMLNVFSHIKRSQQTQTNNSNRLLTQFIDSLLVNNRSRQIGMQLLSSQGLFLEYLLQRGKDLQENEIKQLVVQCYPRIMLQRITKKSQNKNEQNEDVKYVNFQTLCWVYNKVLKYLQQVSSSQQTTTSQQQRILLMCLLRDLGMKMKQYTISSIIKKYKINPKIFDTQTQYRQYLQQKDEYLILRQQMMGQYEKSKRLIRQSLQVLMFVRKEQKQMAFNNSKIISDCVNKNDLTQLQMIMYQTAFEYVYQLLTVLGDVEILVLDKAIRLFVQSINQVMIYSLGKQPNTNVTVLGTSSSSSSSSSIVENKFLLLLTLIEKSAQQTPDLHFIKSYQLQQNKQILKKLIKQYLLKMLKHLMFLPYPTITTSKIITITTSILQNLYNKIFRTNILSTEIFQNTSFIMKFKNHNFKTNTKDQISQFLIQFPYVFPLSIRADKFKEIIRTQRQRYQYHGFNLNDDQSDDDYYGRNIKIRRNRQFQDAFEQLRKKDLRKPFRITFINQLGFEEKGIDAGGLKKEFLNRVLKDALNPKNGMFIENSNHELLPHPTKAQLNEGLYAEYYEFIGKLIGLAIYSNITLGYKFSGTFLNAIVGKKNCFDDLRTIDPSLYKSLIYIKDMKQDAKQLQLTFLYQDEARNRLIQLLPNGHSIPVTNENKRLYISLLTGYKVNRSLQHQTRFIRKGLTQMINKECLFMFNYEELNYLISGQGKIDVDDLKYHTKVVGFQEGSVTIRNFWQVVRQLDEDQKSKLLMFVTACPRPSFLGFRQLSPPFTIACMKDKQHLLPISHTCSNVLELPDYKEKEELKKKLLTAIESNAGFEFG